MMRLFVPKNSTRFVTFSKPLYFSERICYNISCQTKLNKEKDHFLPRGYYTLFWLSSDKSSVKAQLHSDGNKGFPFLFGLCLATIGVAFFGAWLRSRTFYL